MADGQGQADLRSINVQKMAVAYELEASIFKKYVANKTTSVREIRWYQETAGFLTITSPSAIANVSEGARPFTYEQTFTRNTSYVRKYFVESPWIADEDIKDNDVNLLLTTTEYLARNIAYAVDSRIWDVLTESRSVVNINTNATAAAWDTASYTSVNIVEDLMEAKQNIRVNSGFSPEGAVLFLSPKDHRSMINWLIDGKGSSIPQFSSQRVQDGVVMEICGLRVVVSNNVTADYALVMIPEKAATWYSFGELTTEIINEPLIGRKIRVAEWGECTLDRPKCCNLITNTQA